MATSTVTQFLSSRKKKIYKKIYIYEKIAFSNIVNIDQEEDKTTGARLLLPASDLRPIT